MKTKPCLCVGGELDGQWRDALMDRLETTFQVPVDLPRFDNRPISPDFTVEHVAYYRQEWQTSRDGAQRVTVLTPFGQTPGQTMDLLIRNYRPQ